VFGGESVVDADQDDVVAEEPVVVGVEVAEVVAEHHPAAVDRVETRRGTRPAGPLDDRQVDRVAPVARNRHGAAFEPAGLEAVVELVDGRLELAHPGQHLAGECEATSLFEGGEESGEFGVERGAGQGSSS